MGIFVDKSGLGRATLIQVHVVDTTPTPTPTPIPFTHTVPSSMTTGQTYTVSFNGGYNVGQSGVTYTIAEGAGYATTSRHLSKTSGILPGENITLTWYGDTSNGHTVAAPSSITWDVMAMVGTAVGTHSGVTFTLVAARPSAPVLSGSINHTVWPTSINAGETKSLTLSGVTADTGTVTYSVAESGTSYLTFSKSSGVAANETFTVTASSSAPNGNVTVNISANTSPSASNGPKTTSRTMSIVAATQTPTMSGTIQVNIPSTMTAGATGSLTLSGVTSNIGTPTYSISEQGTSYFTFSKTSGITAGETVSWSLAAGAPTRTVTFNASANTSPTASNGPMTGTRTVQVTAAVVTPTLSGTISHNIPSSVTAASNYSVKFGGKSATSGTVLYSVNVNSGSQYVSFSKTSGIAAGETVTMSVASNAPNGGSISGTISANTSPVGASNGPDSVGFSLSTLAIVVPDPTFSGFDHNVPPSLPQGTIQIVKFRGTSSSNGRPVWYSVSPNVGLFDASVTYVVPQTGVWLDMLNNIPPDSFRNLTIGKSATGTMTFTVYANTTKNDGSTFTKSVANIQVTALLPGQY